MRHLRMAALALCLAPALALAADKGAAGHDLSGAWQLDRAKSDSPVPPQGAGGGGMHQGGGGMHQGGGHHGGMGGPPPAGMGGPPPEDMPEGGSPRGHAEGGAMHEGGSNGGGMRRPGLPPFLRITSNANEVAIADSAGTMVQEITFKDVPADAPTVEHHAPRVPGEWKGDKLTVTRTNSRGIKVTETFALEDGGKTLVVQTKMQPEGGGGFEFKRVYHRAGA